MIRLHQYAHHFFPELTGQYLGWKEIALGIFNPLKRTYTARRFAHAIKRRAANYDVIHYHGHYPNLAAFIPSNVNFIQTRHDQGSECLTHIRFKKRRSVTALMQVIVQYVEHHIRIFYKNIFLHSL
jgi:glycogen synthase